MPNIVARSSRCAVTSW